MVIQDLDLNLLRHARALPSELVGSVKIVLLKLPAFLWILYTTVLSAVSSINTLIVSKLRNDPQNMYLEMLPSV